jgi:hypothetical protein
MCLVRLSFVLACALLLSSVGNTQSKGTVPLGQIPTSQNPLPPLAPEALPGQEEKQAKMRNDERQKRLEADTQKLLDLATQLHDEVGKTNKNILSIDVIKRADEIERLAHEVKVRMRG